MAVGGVGVVAPAAVEVAVPAALGGVAVAVVAVVAAAVDPAAGVDPGLNSQTVLERVEVDVATVGGRRLDRRWDRR